ncbi:helix-turn-helix transcriptional regulator [Pseudoflavitalea sp. G-6-1-2]|uniref:helix-turn-helix domain-containing protein n=1 Tax=Pseudoflavitalea sp. G-6-1-2 TaxID=2728841 RepID=UPI00146D7629|nr:AraC family transcriptional regulator [Pseudoflavitalea sp. G-6-1-2]NML21862.1 helix-turn-helix transcriptional regulator [Pseudoflavitalea sp. G-6-1-2]
MSFELRELNNDISIHRNELSVKDFHQKKLVELSSELDTPYAATKMTQWSFDGIRLMHSNWLYKGNPQLVWKTDFEMVHLQFNLKGCIAIEPASGHKALEFGENQHNMIYTSNATGIIRNAGATATQFIMQLDKDVFLQLTNNANENLQRFAEKIMKGEAVSMGDNLPIDFKLQQVIDAILNCTYENSMKQLYYFSKAIEILVLQAEAFNNAAGRSRSVIKTAYDKERIMYAREYLNEHVDNPPNLAALAKLAGLNEYKLKYGFKELFNITAFGFVAEKRLELAKSYLLDEQKTVGETANLLGYSSIQHFSAAFKKKYGISPNKVR